MNVAKGVLMLPVWAAVVVAVLMVALIVVIWSLKRRPRPNLKGFGKADQLRPSISGLVQSTLVGGNRVELLQNGEYFDRLFADLQAAKQTINIETFLSKEGEVTRRITDILAAKAAEGVQVRMMLDGSGGRHFGKKELERLASAGCTVCKYHPPLRIANVGRINNRTHRKLAVIDGRVGFIGGHCFVDTWLGNAEDKKHFRDISARIEGPVVTQLQSAFTDNWIEESGEVIGGDEHFPDQEVRGDVEGEVVFVSPTGGPSTLKLLHYAAIKTAKTSLTIQNPYFLPDPDARKALIEAVERGVTVRVMIPASDATDAKLVAHASHHHYGTLLKGGVRLFDYQKTLLHQKVFTVDHEWCSIGSTNFDDRSFEINDEISLVVFNKRIAAELEETFERDFRDARERTLDEWSKRPVPHKLKDFFAFLLNEQL